MGGLLPQLLKPDPKSLTNKDNKGGTYCTTINRSQHADSLCFNHYSHTGIEKGVGDVELDR